MAKEDKDSTRLEVYKDRSVLFSDGLHQEFQEGDPSPEAQQRHLKIRESLEVGFFKDRVSECKEFDLQKSALPNDVRILLSKLVDSVSSEIGRAVVGLAVCNLRSKPSRHRKVFACTRRVEEGATSLGLMDCPCGCWTQHLLRQSCANLVY